MSEHERSGGASAPLPGGPPPAPDLASVSASLDAPTAPVDASSARVDTASDPVLAPIAAALAGPDRVPGDSVERIAPLEEAPVEHGALEWATVERRVPRAVLGPRALGIAVVSLIASFVVGWMLPLGLAAIVVAIVALRRAAERRGIALWALALGLLSVLYSGGWLLWAAWRGGLLG